MKPKPTKEGVSAIEAFAKKIKNGEVVPKVKVLPKLHMVARLRGLMWVLFILTGFMVGQAM